MEKTMKKVVSLFISFTLSLITMCNITLAAEKTEDFEIDSELCKTMNAMGMSIATDGFTLDEEFLKALSNPGTTKLDSNKDGILTKEELAVERYSFTLDCTDCCISDWSVLQYLTLYHELKITNADFECVNFETVPEDIHFWQISFEDCKNHNKMSGIEKFSSVVEVWLTTDEQVSCSIFSKMENVHTLRIWAHRITDVQTLSNRGDMTLDFKSETEPTSINILNGEKVTGKVGETIHLEVGHLPEGSDKGLVFWSVDNEYIAEIDMGLGEVKLISPGTVTVTASSLNYYSDGTEYWLRDTIEIEVVESSETIEPDLMGDINSDEKVNAEDALIILKHAAKIELIADEKSDVADVNEDTKIDAQDALEVLKIAAKITE